MLQSLASRPHFMHSNQTDSKLLILIKSQKVSTNFKNKQVIKPSMLDNVRSYMMFRPELIYNFDKIVHQMKR